MSDTQLFQKDVKRKMNSYFMKKLSEINFEKVHKDIKDEYLKQLELVRTNYEEQSKRFIKSKLSQVLLSSLSEPSTYYTNDSLLNNGDSKSIYSPRIDLAFSPIIKLSNANSVSIGVYKLSDDVRLFSKVHKLEFVKNIEKKIRIISNENMAEFNLSICSLGIGEHKDYKYPNERPLHLFGIEIENQKNSKHLMGDFFNAINLSKIPVVVIPEDKLDNLMNMLKYNKAIQNVKKLPTYNMLKNVNVLTLKQFRNILNDFLIEEELETIEVNIN